MVKDIENALDELVAHELIAAMAGDEQAREAIRGQGPGPDAIPGPDQMPLADEFLVLDADSSQNYAINAVLAGQSLIIKGPPGTGKSQTIANLIASLVARGKKVLFVAEKRAAIDAVTKRLHQQGLGELVLDLHDGVSSRRAFAQTIGQALAASRERAAPGQRRGAPARREAARQLNAYVACPARRAGTVGSVGLRDAGAAARLLSRRGTSSGSAARRSMPSARRAARQAAGGSRGICPAGRIDADGERQPVGELPDRQRRGGPAGGRGAR